MYISLKCAFRKYCLLISEILLWLNTLYKEHGPVFRIWFGKDLMVFFSDAEDVRQILSNNKLLKKSRNYELSEVWLGKGLLTSANKAWQRRRKLLTPAFHFRILSEFKEPMEDNCQILISKLREKANGEQFDIYPYITLFALDAILETAMGLKKNVQMQGESEYVKAVQTYVKNLKTNLLKSCILPSSPFQHLSRVAQAILLILASL